MKKATHRNGKEAGRVFKNTTPTYTEPGRARPSHLNGHSNGAVVEQSGQYESILDDPLKMYLREIGKVDLLTRQEEIELAKRIKKGDLQAREHMIAANLRLVVKIAHEYEDLGVPLLDLISEGNIGLMKAVDRFDLKKGAKLSTYAALWIRQSMRRALSYQSKTVRLPVYLLDRVSDIRKAIISMSEELKREPTNKELAEELDLNVKQIEKAREAMTPPPVSLDQPIDPSNSDSDKLEDFIADERVQAGSEATNNGENMELVRKLLPCLSEREKKVLELRLGLNGTGEPMTLEEVGRAFRFTRERARQIQNEAIWKMRDGLKNLPPYKFSKNGVGKNGANGSEP